MRYMNTLVPGSAAMLSAGMDKKETADVYRRMRGELMDGGDKLVMVLVTPEKVTLGKKKFVARSFGGGAFCLYPPSRWAYD